METEKNLKIIERAIPNQQSRTDDPYVFIISDESRDDHGTAFISTGWDLSRYNNNPIVTLGHPDINTTNPDLIIGTSEIFFENGRMMARYIPEEGNPMADTVKRKLENGTLNMASIRAQVLDGDYGSEERGQDPETFYFTSQRLLDWGIVMHGSNSNALKQRDITQEVIQRITGDKCVKTENTPNTSSQRAMARIKTARSIINQIKKRI